jgi:lipoprotein-anchoring transpeptidase ErfK/SrfK
MRLFQFALVIAATVFVVTPASAAAVVAQIDLSSQRMTVKVNGKPQHNWRVSTGRSGYSTPTGTYRPKRLERRWRSTIYDNAPMPHSIFFHRGFAIHGTYSVFSLGRPVSHGCVRLSPVNAARLFDLVSRYGMGNTRIVITR